MKHILGVDDIWKLITGEVQGIEYLESTGTQYIDTGITSSGSVERVEMKCRITDVSPALWSANVTCGSQTNGKEYFLYAGIINSNDGIHFKATAGNLNIDDGAKFSEETPSSSTIYEVSYEQDNENLTVTTYNGSYTDSTQFTGSPNNTYSLYLFGRNIASSSARSISCAIYYFKYYRDGLLLRDFIPVRIGTVGYLYDKVSRTLFANQGSGSFTLGPDV